MDARKFSGSRAWHTKGCLFLIGFSILGCLPIDYTPLDQYPFYRKAQARIDKLVPGAAMSGPLQTGASRVEITPPVGLPLAAYGGRTSVGIHAPVFVRALVISNGSSTVAILVADLLAITDDMMRAVTERVGKRLPIPADHILIAATHTHSGPGGLGKRFWEGLAAGPFKYDFFETTIERMVRAVEMAHKDLKPSEFFLLKYDAPDLIKNRIDRDGPKDPEVQALMFQALDRSATTYLVNFSAHPTILRRSNRLVSGDFPGFLSQTLEKREGVVALYTSGAVADQRSRSPQGQDMYERAERMGEVLARRLLESPMPDTGRYTAAVSSFKVSIPLPPPQLKVSSSRRLPVWVGRLFFDEETVLQAIRIHNIILFGIPADIGSEMGLAWKQAAREKGAEVFVVGFSNDYVGYVLPKVYYDLGVDETFMSFNGPYMGDYLDGFVHAVLSGYSEPAQTSPSIRP